VRCVPLISVPLKISFLTRCLMVLYRSLSLGYGDLRVLAAVGSAAVHC
jgi:hypothetical protein